MFGNFLSFMRLSKRLDNRKTISLNSTYISVNGRGLMINELEIGGNGGNEINSIDDEISNYKIESENTKKELYNNHNRTMRRMNSDFNLLKNRIDNISFEEEEEYNKKIMERQKQEMIERQKRENDKIKNWDKGREEIKRYINGLLNEYKSVEEYFNKNGLKNQEEDANNKLIQIQNNINGSEK